MKGLGVAGGNGRWGANDAVPGAPHRPADFRRWAALVIAANFGFWAVDVAHEWAARGLFVVVGGDWARFWGATRVFDAVAPAAAYRLPQIAAAMQPLARYARLGASGVSIGPAPYPPLFLWLFAVFTLPAPPLGFFLWTALNVGLALLVARRLAGAFRMGSSWIPALLVLGAFPLMLALVVGQVVVLLLVCVLQAVTEFERGHELRAGIWTGLLVLKPQYVGCIVLVYLLKRRVAATAGVAIGATAILAGSLAVGGDDGLLAYGRMLITDYPSYAGGTGIEPRGMIGWRSLVLTMFPHLGTVPGLLLVAALSLLTLALLPVIWRGAWEPAGPRFAGQLVATLAVTLLVAYHSQPHGAALLLVPGSLVVARASAPRIARHLLVGAVVGAPMLGVVSALAVGDLSLVSPVLSGVLVVLLVVLVRAEAAEHTRAPEGGFA